jgi:hypothetical protein
MDNSFRSAILPQNAAHRFTWDENNLVIAGEFEPLFSRSWVFVFSQCNARLTLPTPSCNNRRTTATDMPDYDDRKELEGESKEQATHYSKTLDRNSLYGEGKVYVNRNIAHERIVMIMRDESFSTS